MRNKDSLWTQTKKYHEELQEIIEREYDLHVTFTNLLSWGYSTTAYFVETDSKTQGNFVARLSKYSNEKLQKLRKDVEVCEYLADQLPVPIYIKNKNGNCLTHIKKEDMIENSILRLTKHIEGLCPFDLNFDILRQFVDLVKVIHNQDINKVKKKIELPHLHIPNASKMVLLHGDLTPSNILVSYDKVVSILDFEEACIGPAEWDLSRLAIFSWFRMHKLTFAEVLDKVLEYYSDKDINMELLLELTVHHLTQRLEDISAHKDGYPTIREWEKDFNFTKDMLEKLM